MKDFKIVERESQNFTRTIKESMCIEVNSPILQRNIGIVVAYTKVLVEIIMNICSKHSIQTHFKTGIALQNFLVTSKDKDNIKQKNEVTHWYKCNKADYEEHFEESGSTIGEMIKKT